MRKDNPDEWSTIPIRKDTRRRLKKLQLKTFDDVIRDGMGMPPIETRDDES